MMPGGTGPIVAVQIHFIDQPLLAKRIVLLGARKGRQDVEGGQVRIHFQERLKMRRYVGQPVLGKADDVGEVRKDPMTPGEPNDVRIKLRVIVTLVRSQQRLAAEGLDTDK